MRRAEEKRVLEEQQRKEEEERRQNELFVVDGRVVPGAKSIDPTEMASVSLIAEGHRAKVSVENKEYYGPFIQAAADALILYAKICK